MTMATSPNMKKPTAAKSEDTIIHQTSTPVIAEYDHRGFVIDGVRCDGAVTMLADNDGDQASYTIARHPSHSIDANHLPFFNNLAAQPHVLLIGVGAVLSHPHYALRQALQKLSLTAEIVPTPAACRTWNLLLSEGRRLGFIALPIGITSGNG